MQLTLKVETKKPARKNFLQQQAKFDNFVDCFNNERSSERLTLTPAVSTEVVACIPT